MLHHRPKWKSFSSERQDSFVHILKPTPGYFLDIGCAAIEGSNTYGLEKIGWNGLLFDYNADNINLSRKIRRSKAFVTDVTRPKFLEILRAEVQVEFIDYVSLDVDESSLAALENFLELGKDFGIMTFEHDLYKDTDTSRKLRSESRRLLSPSHLLLFSDVIGPIGPWEDWWINPRRFKNNNITPGTRLDLDTIFSRLKNYRFDL